MKIVRKGAARRFGGWRNRPARKSKKVFKRRVARVAKTVALREQETKYSLVYTPSNPANTEPLSNITNTANGMYYGSFTSGITQGVNEGGQRVGNEITLKGSSVRMTCNPSAPESAEVRYPIDMYFRFLVLKVNPGLVDAWNNSLFTRPTPIEIFTEANGNGDPLQWYVKSNKERNGVVLKKYYDRVHKLAWGNDQNNTDLGLETDNPAIKFYKFHIDWHNTKFQFAANTSTEVGTKFDLIWLMIPFSRAYNPRTEEVMAWSMSRKTWFKDG